MEPVQESSRSAEAEGRGYTVGSIIMMIVALAIIPPLFGVAGVALGIVGYRKGDPLGRVAALGSAAAAVIGVALGILLNR